MDNYVTKLRKAKNVVVVGAGGGGDVVSAFVLCKVLEEIVGVHECFPLGVLWERWVVDPYPGPIPVASVRNARLSKCVWVSGNTYVVRGRYSFKPHTAYVAEKLGREIPAVTLEGGVSGVYECFKELVGNGENVLIDLDVGGDILAEGWEDNLWSPLTDSITLAATAKVGGFVGVTALGADGELSQDFVLQKINNVISIGGYVGVIGLWSHHVSFYEDLIDRVKTEASRAPYLTLKGFVGGKKIRGGSRTIEVNALTLITFFLKSESLMKINKLAQAISDTTSLAKAWSISRKLGIPTELDLEIVASKIYGVGPEASPEWGVVRSYVKKLINT
ncbi:MAG: DUF1152 domain-containing protein [Desulfurococcaceae archaeon TW002]